MTDIVERLRGKERALCDATDEEALDCREGACNCDWKTRQEAADEIERLREALSSTFIAVEQLCAALDVDTEETFIRIIKKPSNEIVAKRSIENILKFARAALGEGKE